jgi:hypothetical protein
MRALIYGAIAGLNGGACMSALRVAARRIGLIDVMPPQVLRDAAGSTSGHPDAEPVRHIEDHALHLAISTFGGVAYGALYDRRVTCSVSSGMAFGLGMWGASLLLLALLPGRRRSRAHMDFPQIAVNLAAHLVYGAAMAGIVGDMREQDRHRARRPDRDATRVG